jgi:tRNA pseudouridine13 synthase
MQACRRWYTGGVALPYLTSALPGIGGTLRTLDDDFAVDEELPYAPSGAGDHVFVRIEKRGMTSPDAARAIARALGVRDRDIGIAGMKDRRAVTRQWMSLPPPVTPEQALALDLSRASPGAGPSGVRVLEAVRHGHKLRTGHVRANRFTLRVRGAVPDAAERARAILGALAEPPRARQGAGHRRRAAWPRSPARSADGIGAAVAAVQRLADRTARRWSVPACDRG